MKFNKLFKRIWVWRNYSIGMWFEAFLVTIIVMGLCYLANPTNPLFLREIFPWPWVATIIVIFQYGVGPSLFSFFFITAEAWFIYQSGSIAFKDFQIYVLSGMFLAFICSLFSSSWARRIVSAEVMQHYTEDRLKSLSRSYYMLRISTDYLEQNIITKPFTLRIAFEELLKINLHADGQLDKESANLFIQIIVQFCQINTAGIYLAKNNKLYVKPFASIGNLEPLIMNDPLIKKSFYEQQISFVGVNEIENANDCNYLVSVPLINSEEQVFGLFVIKEMPFWNLNEDTIRVISILCYYFSQDIVLTPPVKEFFREFPECDVDFVKLFSYLIVLHKEMDTDSALVAIKIPQKYRIHNVIYNLKNQQRILDSGWSLEMGDYDVLLVLLPFSSASHIQGYLNRISTYLKKIGLDMEKDQIIVRSMQLYDGKPVDVMRYFLNFIKD